MEGHPLTELFRNALSRIKKESGNKVSFKLYAGGVVGDEIDVLRKLRINRLQMGHLTGVGLGPVISSIRVLEIPGLFQDHQEMDYVVAAAYELFEEAFEKKGIVLIGWGNYGFIKFFSRKNPVPLNNMHKLKMWVWKDDKNMGLLMGNLGLTCTPLHLGDVRMGFETGMIEACYGAALFATGFQWHAFLNYVLKCDIGSGLSIIAMNKNAFYVLTPETRDIIKQVARDVLGTAIAMTRKLDAEAFEIMKEQGIQVVQPTEDQSKYIRNKSEKYVEQCIQKGLFSQKDYNNIVNMVNEYRSSKKVIEQP
jgi:TRAP-type transport system periplasmic protein